MVSCRPRDLEVYELLQEFGFTAHVRLSSHKYLFINIPLRQVVVLSLAFGMFYAGLP